MTDETFTEWAERNSLDLTPWQTEMAEGIVSAIEQGDRITIVSTKRGGRLTVGRALERYWTESGAPSPRVRVDER